MPAIKDDVILDHWMKGNRIMWLSEWQKPATHPMQSLGCFFWAVKHYGKTLVDLTCCYDCHFGYHDKKVIRGKSFMVCCCVAQVCLKRNCLCISGHACTSCEVKVFQ